MEALLEAVRQEVRRRLLARDGYDYREAVLALAADAIGQMPGSAFVVKISAAGSRGFG